MHYTHITSQHIEKTVTREVEKHKDSVIGFVLSDKDVKKFLSIDEDGYFLTDDYSVSAVFKDAETISYYVNCMKDIK